jgi:seryl-tRNA synthetase
MLDIKVIRNSPEVLKKALIRRGDIDFADSQVKKILSEAGLELMLTRRAQDELLKHADQISSPRVKTLESLDAKRRDLVFKVEQMKAERNKASMEIAVRKKAGHAADDIMEAMKQVSDQIKQLDEEVNRVDAQMEEFLLEIPNIPGENTPTGLTSDDNPEYRRFREPPTTSFVPKDHVELATKLGILDLERAAKIAGARFGVLMNAGARLERALIAFMLDLHTQKHGYTEILPPFIVNSTAMRGTGQLPKFEEDLFKLKDTDYYLIPTAEVPVTNLYAQEILPESRLTIKHVAYTPCFRSEAGSHGKDTRGLMRVHQFNKVELVKFSHPDRSYEELESLLQDAEQVLKLLELPFRVVTLCSGDLGFSAAKTYDIEVWVPSQKAYREVSSCSNFEDFQARRANIRFKGDAKGAKPSFVHTLNGSGVAIGRIWLAIMENYQDEKGRVAVPAVLQPYMGGLTQLE